VFVVGTTSTGKIIILLATKRIRTAVVMNVMTKLIKLIGNV
jgi:hypothetical protein